jgi:ABC-type sugar transport system ATPase subunit
MHGVTFVAMNYASVENLSKSFGIRTLFKNITINIDEGDKIALVARNGSGKSTLMKILAGLDTADSGTVWVHKDIKTIMLQQDHDFDGNKSIWEHVLRTDNEVVRVVKAYEEFLEMGSEDHDRLSALMAKLDELNAWNFESDIKQILGKLNLHQLNEPVKNLSHLPGKSSTSKVFFSRSILFLSSLEPSNQVRYFPLAKPDKLNKNSKAKKTSVRFIPIIYYYQT